MELEYSKTALKPRRFWVGFLLGLGTSVLINLIPYAWSNHAYYADCYERIGFPLTFRSAGGASYHYMFSRTALLDDIVIGVGFALAVATVWRWWDSIRSRVHIVSKM